MMHEKCSKTVPSVGNSLHRSESVFPMKQLCGVFESYALSIREVSVLVHVLVFVVRVTCRMLE